MLPVSYATALTDLLYTQAPKFVGIYDPALGWFTQVNAAGVNLLGYPSEAAFLADSDHSLRTPPWTAPQWQALCGQARREGRLGVTAEIRRHAGEPLSGYLELIYFEVGGQPFFLVQLTAQNRLQQAERALAHSVRRFEAVFANATIGIIVCDEPGTIVSVNALAGQLFGYEPEALTGQLIERLVPEAVGRPHEQLRDSFNAHPHVRIMGEQGGQRELLGQRQDGSTFPVEVSLSYFHLDQALYVVAYVLDITRRKAAERELLAQHQRVARLNAELEQRVADRTHALVLTLEQLEQRGRELAAALLAEQELGELKSRFVSMASHEFRTPLTVVRSSAALVLDYPGAHQQAQRAKHVHRIQAAVTNLNDILEEFLSVGRLEEGQVVAQPARLDLPTLLAEATAEVQSLLKTGQTITAEITSEPDCPDPLHLDGSLLRKILVNLLSNALKYSDENSAVAVRAVCQPQRLTLSVQDHGLGISEADQAHLFERFFRARNVAALQGTGLGLYIVARYVELLGGTITLASILHQGTTVTLSLPYGHYSAD